MVSNPVGSLGALAGSGSPLYGGWSREKAIHWATVRRFSRFLGSSLTRMLPLRIE